MEEIVHFYNVRDVEDFPPAEYPETVNKDELGNLGLSQEEETAIVAFFTNIDGLHQIKISLSKNFLQPLIVFL